MTGSAVVSLPANAEELGFTTGVPFAHLLALKKRVCSGGRRGRGVAACERGGTECEGLRGITALVSFAHQLDCSRAAVGNAAKDARKSAKGRADSADRGLDSVRGSE